MNRVADENSWPAAEIFEKLALTAVLEGEKIDEPNMVMMAVAQATTAKQAEKKVVTPRDRPTTAAPTRPYHGGKGGGKGWNGGYNSYGNGYGNGGGRYGRDDHYDRGRSRSPRRDTYSRRR